MADALLVVREGAEAGREVPLTAAITIGRTEGVDLVLVDAGISRQHARISPEGIGAVIEDLGSSNGTFVNAERIDAPRRLRDGDEIHLGSALIAFVGGTEETQVMDPTDPDATEAFPGPGAAGAAAAGAAGPEQPPPRSRRRRPPRTRSRHPKLRHPRRRRRPQTSRRGTRSRCPSRASRPPRNPPRSSRPRRPPPRREPIPQPDPAAAATPKENDWNLPALGAIILGPLSIALIIFSSGSGFYAALPVAVTGIALGTIGRNKVDRGESTRYRSLASAGRTFAIVGTVLAAIILVAVIAINQLLDVSAENLDELIDEVRAEIEGNIN